MLELGDRLKSLIESLGEKEMVVLKKMIAYEDYKKKMEELEESKKRKTNTSSLIANRVRDQTLGNWGIETWSDIQLKNHTSEGEEAGREKAMTLLNFPHQSLDPLATDLLLCLRLKDVSFNVKERLSGLMRFFPFLNFFRTRNLSILKVNGLHPKMGSVIGVMGPSGAGKSTLLQILAGRYDTAEVMGRVEVEMGEASEDEGLVKKETICLTPNKHCIWAKNNVGYVSQECHLWPTLTVRETLYFSAYLYLPSSLPLEQKRKRADEVMKFIGLEEVADVKVGSSLSKGISGGQQKRLSLGVELINAPAMLILDEPTSGLDSAAASKVIRLLRKVAHMGRIVMLSIHQPNQAIFEQFDKILFLNKGRIVFDGSPEKMHRYAASLGFRCPIDENPADYFMTVFKDLNVSEEDFKKWEKEEEIGEKEEGEEGEGKEDEEEGEGEEGEEITYTEENIGSGERKKSFKNGKCNRTFKDHIWVFLILLYREMVMICRDWVFMLQLPLGAILSALIASLYADIGGPGGSITTAFSLFVPFYFLQGYAANTALRLCDDHHILRWELSQKLYHELPFFLARWIVVESCYYTLMAQLVCCVWYWTVGIEHSTADFFYFCLMCQMVVYFASSIARLYAMILPHTTFINLSYQVVAGFLANMNGWFITYNSMVDFWSWVFWINPYSYYIMAIMPRELEKTLEGQALVEQLDFPITGHYYIYPLVILGETCIVLVISYLAFKFLHKKIM